MRALYSILIYALFPAVLIVVLMQTVRRSGGSDFLLQRMGWRHALDPETHSRDYWFHAASVGEVQQIFPLLQQLLFRRRNFKLVVSVTTPESMAMLKNFVLRIRMSDVVECVYCPLDFYFATRRFVRTVSASALFVVETEIWPNLYHEVAAREQRLHIINARLSEKTLGAPAFIRQLYHASLAGVNSIAARTTTDAEHFKSLGVDDDCIKVLGNLKRCATPTFGKNCPDFLKQRSYVLFISSREHEEALVWSEWLKLEEQPLLVIAPRHLQRVAMITEDLERAGARTALLSELDNQDPDIDVLIIDAMGRVPDFLPDTLFAIVGGSFQDFGGHNVLEPALMGKRVLVGPYIKNIEEDVRWLKEFDMLFQAAKPEQIPEQISVLLASGESPGLALQESSDAIMRSYLAFIEGSVIAASDIESAQLR